MLNCPTKPHGIEFPPTFAIVEDLQGTRQRQPAHIKIISCKCTRTVGNIIRNPTVTTWKSMITTYNIMAVWASLVPAFLFSIWASLVPFFVEAFFYFEREKNTGTRRYSTRMFCLFPFSSWLMAWPLISPLSTHTNCPQT